VARNVGCTGAGAALLACLRAVNETALLAADHGLTSGFLEWSPCIDGVEVLCAGYKYNSRKVLHFCWPLGAASWVPGEPYIARFQDDQDGASYREVARLSVFSRYFGHSNKVDVGNELRQGFLALEAAWVTTDCWFRLFTGLLGITVTDAYLAYTTELHAKHPDKDMTIKEFANMVALQMIDNKLDGSPKVTRAGPRPPAPSASPLASHEHTLVSLGRTPSKKDSTKMRAIQLRCKICHEKTGYFCSLCGRHVGICQGTSTNPKDCILRHLQRFQDSASPSASFSSPPASGQALKRARV
jgi:hypothetical protein